MEYTVKEYKTDKCTIVIRKPILTRQERKAREEEAKKALVAFYKECLKDRRAKENAT